LESFEVADARYLGRGKPYEVKLSPWFTAIIGGRGTGKSSLVEFLRIEMRREDEVQEAIRDDLSNYRGVYRQRRDEGLLTQGTRFVATYRKDRARFRIQWSQDGEQDPILEEREGGGWVTGQGDIARRFPVRIYSQKQIYQLAKAPLGRCGRPSDQVMCVPAGRVQGAKP